MAKGREQFPIDASDPAAMREWFGIGQEPTEADKEMRTASLGVLKRSPGRRAVEVPTPPAPAGPVREPVPAPAPRPQKPVRQFVTPPPPPGPRLDLAARTRVVATPAPQPPAGEVVSAASRGSPRRDRGAAHEARDAQKKEAEKLRAKAAVIVAQEKMARIRERIKELQNQRQPYEAGWLSRVRLGSLKGRDDYVRLRRDLGDLESELRSAQEEYDRAKREALTLGVLEAELAPAREAVPAAAERETVAPAPQAERPPREPEKAKWWIWTREIAKGITGAGASILGVKFFYDGVQYIREQRAKRKATTEVDTILGDIDRALTAEARAPARAGEHVVFSEEKSQALFAKLEELVKSGKLTEERRGQLLVEMRDIAVRRAKAEEVARAQLSKETGQAINDYLETKVSTARVAREFLNTAFVLTGLQLVRGGAMLALGAVERSAKKWREQELAARAGRFAVGGEGRKPDVWEKLGKTVWQGNIKDASREFARSLALHGATKERVSTLAKAMDFGRALGTVGRFVGVGLAVHAESTEGGLSQSIEDLVKGWEDKGAGVFLDNLRRNVYHILHMHPKGERGHETLEPAHKEAPPEAEKPEAVVAASAEMREQEGMKFLNAHGVLKSLVEGGEAEFTLAPDGHKELILNLDESQGGFGEVQQALRRLFGQYITLEGNRFKDTDADRLEKMVKLATHILRGDKIPSRLLDQGFEIPANFSEIVHFDAQGNVEVDLERFEKELAPALEKVADHYNVSMMAYINNTSHRVWQQEIADARAQGTGAQIAVDDFDRSARVHEAEREVAQYTAKTLGLPDVDVVEVRSEDTFNITIDHQVIPVEDGRIEMVRTMVGGQTYTYQLAEAVDVEHAYAGHDLQEALAAAKGAATVEAQGGGGAPTRADLGSMDDLLLARRPPGEVPDFHAFLKDAAAHDGYVHFGEVRFKPEVLDRIDELRAGEFAKDPIGSAGVSWIRRLSDEAFALRALANTIKAHPDTGSVGEYIMKHKVELEGWMRAVPKPGEGIVGV